MCVCVYLPSGQVPSGFPIKILSTFCLSSVCITCLVPLVLLVIILRIVCREYKP